MNRDRSIQAQAIIKAVVPVVPRTDWRSAVMELLDLHDAIVASSQANDMVSNAMTAAASPQTSTPEVSSGGKVRGYLKTCKRDSPTKVYAVIEDDRAGLRYQGSAWRTDGDELERIPVGTEIEVSLKIVEKNGKRFTNFLTPSKVSDLVTIAGATTERFDDIPF